MKQVLHIIDMMSEYSARIFAFLIIAITAVIAFEVIARYIFNSPTLWAQEVAILINGVYFIIGGGLVLLRDAHVRMDAIYNRFPPRQRAISSLITSIPFFFVFIGTIVWQSSLNAWIITMRLQTTGSTFNAPIWPTRWGLVVAATLLLLQGIATFIRNLNTAITGREVE